MALGHLSQPVTAWEAGCLTQAHRPSESDTVTVGAASGGAGVSAGLSVWATTVTHRVATDAGRLAQEWRRSDSVPPRRTQDS